MLCQIDFIFLSYIKVSHFDREPMKLKPASFLDCLRRNFGVPTLRCMTISLQDGLNSPSSYLSVNELPFSLVNGLFLFCHYEESPFCNVCSCNIFREAALNRYYVVSK